VATINGVQHGSVNRRFTVHGAHGTYEIEFALGFAGAFDPINVASVSRQLDLIGADQNGLAHGANAQAIINGQSLTGDKSLFRFVADGHRVVLDFQPAFVGQFDPISASGKSHTVTETFQSWRRVADRPLPSAADAAATQQPSDPIDRLLNELDDLTAPSRAGSASSRAATKPEITIQSFARLSHDSPLASFFATDPEMAGTIRQLRHALDLLA
jgi:hypothetical protein